jgi:F-type H+-transporting ATPase subunit epsilon
MAEKLTLELVTPIKRVVAGQADMIILPAAQGEIGVMPGHDLYMALLQIGVLKMIDGNDTKYYFVAQGYAEISQDRVRVLAEVCEPTDEIDLERAITAQKRAEERLAKSASDDAVDVARAQAALRRANVRQQLKRGEV